MQTDKEGASNGTSDGEGRSNEEGKVRGHECAPLFIPRDVGSPSAARPLLGSPKENRPPGSQSGEQACDSHGEHFTLIIWDLRAACSMQEGKATQISNFV